MCFCQLHQKAHLVLDSSAFTVTNHALSGMVTRKDISYRLASQVDSTGSQSIYAGVPVKPALHRSLFHSEIQVLGNRSMGYAVLVTEDRISREGSIRCLSQPRLELPTTLVLSRLLYSPKNITRLIPKSVMKRYDSSTGTLC